MQEKVLLYGVGDIGIHRQQPETALVHVAPTIKGADIAFCQLERTLSERGTPIDAVADHSRVHPVMASALETAGFNVVGFATNHTLDWGVDAFFDTIDALKSRHMEVVGVGKNLAEARKPVIVTCKGTKVAFLGYCSVARAGYEAGPDRPGLCPLRAATLYQAIESQPGTPCDILSFPDPGDLEAMEDDIRSTRKLADVVVVSIHWGIHFQPATVAMYQRHAGHAAINAGADIIFGHHAHILKGMEVYKGKVITYSMGNFCLENSYELVMRMAQRPAFRRMMRMYNWVPDPAYTGYGFPVDSRKSLVLKCVLAKGKIESVSFLPVFVNRNGEPEMLAPEDERFGQVVDYMRQITQSQGLNAKYETDGNEVIIS